MLRLLCSQSGENVLVAPDVRGTMHANLRGLGWRQAFDTVVNTCGLRCADYGGIVVVAGHYLQGRRAKSFQAAEANVDSPFEVPDVAVDLSLDDASVGEAVTELARRAGVTIAGAIPRSEARVTLHVSQAPWFDVLNYIAWKASWRIEQPKPGEIALAVKTPHDASKETSLHCHHALAPELLQLLARRADRNFVISPDVSGGIEDVDLVGVDYETALEAIADAYGFRVEEPNGVLTVTVNPDVKVARPAPRGCDGAITYGDQVRATVGALGTVLYVPREPGASEVITDTSISNYCVAEERHRRVGEVHECRTDFEKDGAHQAGRCKAKIVAIHERSIDLEIDGSAKASLELGK
jgi:hypothetical protein